MLKNWFHFSISAWALFILVPAQAQTPPVLAAASALGARALHQNGIRFRRGRQETQDLALHLVRNMNARVQVTQGTLLSNRATRTAVNEWVADTAAVPELAPAMPETGPFEITLTIDNDNLLFGIYAIVAGRDVDGTDFGRTHGMALSVSYGVARGIRLGLDLDTVIYTRPVDSSITRASSAGGSIPIYFNELSQVRFRMDWADPSGGPWRLQMGGGAVVQNREGMSHIGASGQQELWHELSRAAFNPNLWTFEHTPDGGGVHAGPFVLARGGVEGGVGNEWIRLRAHAMAGAEFSALTYGSRVGISAGGTLEIGRAVDFHLVVGVEQDFDIYLMSGAVTGATHATVRLASQPFDFWLAMNFYELDPNLLYTIYNFNNATMTAGLTVRF